MKSLNDYIIENNGNAFESEYSMLIYNYKKNDWEKVNNNKVFSDSGCFPTLDECIKQNIKDIKKLIEKDGNYRYLEMTIG